MNNTKMIAIGAAAIVILLLIISANPQGSDTFRKVSNARASQQGKSLLTGKRILKLCPPARTLTYTQLKWKAPGGWKSLDKPLSNTVGQFTKAQWQGVNLGEVICQYRSGGASNFPIELHRLAGKTVLEPMDAAWKKTHVGTKTCVSSRPHNCPFYQQEEETQKSYPELYKEIFESKDDA
jgi:hypothetical protein